MARHKRQKKLFILGITSDIGLYLAHQYSLKGWKIYGSYKNIKASESLPKNWKTKRCDLGNENDINRLVIYLKKNKCKWNLWINAIGLLEPIGPFFFLKYKKWINSFTINCLSPLIILHRTWALRSKTDMTNVLFFAGAGTNGPASNYSAYCLAKICLIKMVELLHFENNKSNFFIIGPGIVKTKIHCQTIKSANSAGENLEKIVKALKDPNKGTPMSDIFNCLQWCIHSGRSVCGGRNISLVFDSWKNSKKNLNKQLRNHPDMYRLRRFGNASPK